MSAVEREIGASTRVDNAVDATAVRSVEARLLRRLLRLFGNPPFAFVLWTGERIATAPGELVASVRIADRATLLGLIRDPRMRFGDAYSDGKVEIEGDIVQLLEAIYRGNGATPPPAGKLRRL